MAWNDVADNQMVSFTDAQTSGFDLNSGQSSVTSNQCMTKNDITTKYNVSSSAMSAYANNQLVPRSVWVSGLNYVEYRRTDGRMTGASVCILVGTWTAYAYQQNGTGRFFTTSALTTVFNGNNQYYIFYDSISENLFNYQIDNNGYVSNSYDCLF